MSDETKKAKGAETTGAMNRRNFIRAAGAGALAGFAAKRAHASVYKSILPSSVLGANDKILTGHIGTGGMGRANLGFVLRRNDIQPIALCDCHPANLDRGAQMASQKFPEFDQHHDFRELLENKDIDAVVISTSDHWHCLCTLYAADAGKDIYCEKPLSTTIEEGNAMVDAVNRNNVVFQGGNMQRSGAHFQEAVRLVQAGHIGDIARVETWSHDNTTLDGIGMGDDDMSNYPVDWEFHQGWVEHRPFNTNRWIYNFRWFLEYSGGKITDWGAHLIDIGLWAMGEEKQPSRISAQGGMYMMKDNRTTPDTLEVAWEFEDYLLTFSNRVWNPQLFEGTQSDHGIVFYGSLGLLRVDRSGYEVIPFPNNGGCEPVQGGGGPINEPHWQNFVDCVRSREKPICDVETLNNTTRICHMGTCAYVAGARFASGAEMKDGELPDEAPISGGAMIEWDHDTQRFVGGDTEAVKKANQWAYREYKNGWSLKAPYYIG